MAQKRYLEFRADDNTFDLNNWFLGILVPGLYRGFDFLSTNSLTLTFNHLTSGIQTTEIDGTLGVRKGVMITPQGVVIKEDATVELPVDVGTSQPRIDLVVCTHLYSESIIGGTSAIYSVIKGTPAGSPVAPSLTFPLKQTALGQLYIPASMTALDDVGVVYTRASNPEFSGGVDIAYLNSVKANKTYVDSQDSGLQAQITSLLSDVALKAYKTYVDTQDTGLQSQITTLSSVKATITYVDSQDAGLQSQITTLSSSKAATTYVNSQDAGLQSQITTLNSNKANTAQSAWIYPSLNSSFVNNTYGYEPFGYMKDTLGFVHLRGILQSWLSGSMVTLPSGYRPLNSTLFYGITWGATGSYVQVGSNGQISIGSAGSGSNANNFLSLEGIIFPGEQ